MPTCVLAAIRSRCPGAGPERLREQVADAAGGPQRRGVAGGLVIIEQADQVVLVDPNVPCRPALLVDVGAEIAVGLLRGHEGARHAVHLRFQAGVPGVAPGIAGGVEILADVLADPGLLARRLLEAAQETRLVNMQQAAFEVDAQALAEHAFDVLLLEGGGHEAVGDTVGHDGGEGEGRREREQRCGAEDGFHTVTF